MNFANLYLLVQVPADEGTGLWDLFMRASPAAYLILGILAVFSLSSWTVMIGKVIQLGKSRRQSQHFLEIFRSSKRFSEVNAAANQHLASPLVGIFQAGYVEIDSQVKAVRRSSTEDSGESYLIKSMGGVERTLRRAAAVELQVLSRHLHLLATTAAASPFIGLLGTVIGITIAFNDIGVSGSTSIVAVAPGIAEALINTAAGLVAAIPALIGYNVLQARTRLIRDEMEDFVLEFVSLAERNFT